MEANPGKRLQQWREFKGATLTEMHRTTGIKVTTLSQAESGTTNPSYDTISKVLAAYPDLNPDWLLLGTGAMLRDGRTLASVAHGRTHGEARTAVQAPEPAAPMTINRLTPEEVAVMQSELVATKRELATANQTIERLWGQNTELIKKPEASADAATDLRDEADDIMQQYYAEQGAKQYRIAAQANYGAIMGRWVSLVPAA